MSKGIPIGPGAGGLAAGLAWGRIRGAEDEAAELAAELAATKAKLIRMTAAAHGCQAVTDQMVRELEAEQRGRPIARRLSDPANGRDRQQLREDVEEDMIRRLSGGRLQLHRTTERSKRRTTP